MVDSLIFARLPKKRRVMFLRFKFMYVIEFFFFFNKIMVFNNLPRIKSTDQTKNLSFNGSLKKLNKFSLYIWILYIKYLNLMCPQVRPSRYVILNGELAPAS